MIRSTPPVVWVASSLIVAVLAITGVAVYLDRTSTPNKLALENPDDVRREILEAFRDPKTNVEVPGGVKELFEQAGKDMSEGGQHMGEYFDIDRFAEELNRDGALDRAGVGPANPLGHRDFKTGLLIGLPKNADLLSWYATEFRAWKWLRPDKEAVVIVKHRARLAGEEIGTKMRWWLVRGPMGWKLYDLEDLSGGGRISTLIGLFAESMLARGAQQIGELRAFSQRFQEAKSALVEKDFARMEKVLEADFPRNLPTKLNALLYLWRSMAFAGQAKSEQALAEVRRAERLDPSMPLLAYIRAVAHNQLGQFEESLAQSKRFMDQVGPDDVMLLNQGIALEGLGRLEEAREAFSRSFDELPTPEAVSWLRRCLDPNQKAEFAQRVFRLPKPDEQFRRFIDEAMAAEDDEAANALIDGYARIRPDDVELLYQRARFRVRLGDLDGAQPIFLMAIDRAPRDDRARYLNGFIYTMLEKGKSLEAYSAVSDADASQAFDAVAGNLLFPDFDEDKAADFAKLEMLIDVHRKRKPKDPLLNYYSAQILFENKDYAAVERLLAEAMANDLEANDLNRHRWLRVQALYKAGKGLIAYQTVRPAKTTFSQLAHAYQADSNLDGLEALLEAHRRAEPQDADGIYWKGQLHFRRAEYAEAIKQFDLFRFRRGNDGHEYDWQLRDSLIRSLVRLKRIADAECELEKEPERYRFSLLYAVIVAAAGKVAETEAILDELAKNQWLPATFHADPDLGPALRSEPFAKLREKYPPPKDARPLKKT